MITDTTIIVIFSITPVTASTTLVTSMTSLAVLYFCSLLLLVGRVVLACLAFS